jgi:hypothetical protein
MTPRQIAGTLYFATRPRRRGAADHLARARLRRGGPRDVQRELDDLQGRRGSDNDLPEGRFELRGLIRLVEKTSAGR